MKGKVEQQEAKEREGFDLEERAKKAEAKAQQLTEEVNMLRGRLIVVETREAVEG